MPRSPNPRRSIGFLLVDVSHLLRRNFNRRVHALGLTQAQWRAIAHLARGEGVTQAALAERLEIQPITLARLIDRMQAAGWVERRADPQDRRASCLHLTPKSQPILAVMHDRAAETLEEALAGVSASARKKLVEALLRMKENLVSADAALPTGRRIKTNARRTRRRRSE